MDVKRHNGNVLPKKPWTLVRGFLIFHGYACTVTPATTLHPTSATRTRFQLTPDRVRGCDSCPACTATRCR